MTVGQTHTALRVLVLVLAAAVATAGYATSDRHGSTEGVVREAQDDVDAAQRRLDVLRVRLEEKRAECGRLRVECKQRGGACRRVAGCTLLAAAVKVEVRAAAMVLTTATSVRDAVLPCGRRVRKAWSSLSYAEREHYLGAVAAFKASEPATYDALSTVHQQLFAYAHGTSAFLSWHRWFVLGYENSLRAQRGYECVTVPYWDWETDDGNETASDVFRAEWFGSTDGVNSTTGCVTEGVASGWVASDGRCVSRNIFTRVGFAGAAQLAKLLGEAAFKTFRLDFEAGPHAAPHIFVGGLGGHMSSRLSPDDPLFFVHHANVDRIWALWQDYHGYDEVPLSQLNSTHYFPAVDFTREVTVAEVQLDATMPFSTATLDIAVLRGSPTVRSTYSIAQLGMDSYVYGTDALAHLLGRPRAGEWDLLTPGMEAAVACDNTTQHSTRRQHFKDAAVEASYEEMKARDVDSDDMFTTLAQLECTLHLSGKNGNDVFSDDFIRRMGKDPQQHRKYYTPCAVL